MSASWFLDTNILLYAYDVDAGAKREIALRRVEEAFLHPDRTSISVQVLQEFHVNFVKAGHSTDEAAMIVSDFSVWRVVDNTWTLFKKGLELQSRWQLSLWDAMILAAARHAGSAELLTEDFNAGQDYGGIRVLNPFLHP